MGEQVAIINGKLRIGKDNNRLFLPDTAYVRGTKCLNHTLLPIDAYWAHGWGKLPDWTNFPFSPLYSNTPDGMEPPIYKDEQLQSFVKNFTDIGGAVTLNAGIFQEGHLGKLTIKQLQKLKKKYKYWKANS